LPYGKRPVSTKKTISLFLAFILVTGTIALSFPSSMRDVQAQQGYDGTYNNYENDYGKDNSHKSIDNKIVKKVKCNNINVNVNGLELNVLPPFLADSGIIGAEAAEGNNDANSIAGNSDASKINDFRFICINNNNNIVIEEEEPTPPVPPVPPIPASLTVNKEIFGCDNIIFDPLATIMSCRFQEFIPCDDPDISDTSFCQALTENFFDIEVLDDENNQIAQFEGSAEGETIENLEPGTYTVNEIVVSGSPTNQLFDNGGFAEQNCNAIGFEDGGFIFRVNDVTINYLICFEYEDELGNDCSTITLAAGESRTCTVKNYIVSALDFGTSPAGGLTASNINSDTSLSIDINTSGSQAASFSSPPTIAQGTEQDLSALEKVEKLKKQWLELLP
jgi:hypothetical protein